MAISQHIDHKTNNAPQHTWLQSASAGIVGTLPMTIFMFATQRFLPKGQRYSLPPEIVTHELAQRVHIRHKMNKGEVLGATTVSHFGYGATMGLLYSPLQRAKSLPTLLKGSLFGLFIWAGNYLALLPALGMRAAGQKEPPQRNWMMIVAHIVWGATTALVAERKSK
jgi:putative membrane protein